jgi:hypothetical protein
MMYAVETASDGVMYVSSFMTIGSGIQVIFRVLPQQSERLQCWHYRWDRFMKYAADMISGGMIYTPSFMTIGSGIRVILRVLPQQYLRLQCW